MDRIVSITVSMSSKEIDLIENFMDEQHNFSATARWLIRRGAASLKQDKDKDAKQTKGK